MKTYTEQEVRTIALHAAATALVLQKMWQIENPKPDREEILQAMQRRAALLAAEQAIQEATK